MSVLSPFSPVHVIGSGGHAKVVIATLQAASLEIAAIYDDDERRWGTSLMGISVKGPIQLLEKIAGQSAVIAIGNNEVRRRLSQNLKLRWISAIHPMAYVHSSVQIGAGTVIFAGAVVQPDAVVGDHVIVNSSATVDHDSVLEDFVHIAPGAHLAGNVRVRQGAFLGIGSAAIPGVEIGAWSTVGAGAVVVRDVPQKSTVIGVPAKPRY